jgi:hypothetical protein
MASQGGCTAFALLFSLAEKFAIHANQSQFGRIGLESALTLLLFHKPASESITDIFARNV